MYIIKNIFLCFFILYCPNNIIAQADSSKVNYNQAIQFYIIDQVIVAYKYHFSDNSAVRITLNATGLFNNEDADEIDYRETRTDTLVYVENRENTSNNQFYEIKFQYLYHTQIHNIIKLFYGAGPFLSYQFYQDEVWRNYHEPNPADNYNTYFRSNSNILRVGMSLVIGLECTVYNNINLFTEYEAVVSRGWRNNDYFSDNQSFNSNDHSYDLWTYELKGLRAGICIYF